MDMIFAVQEYITRMVADIPGMKILLLDPETVQLVSMVYTQSQILQKEVYLVERIDMATREQMMHLSAICFLRPTGANMNLLTEELQTPKYKEYHIFFSNEIKTSRIQELADADSHEVVMQLQEFYADTWAVNKDFFHLKMDIMQGGLTSWDQMQFTRTSEGLIAALLAVRKRPDIRFSATSVRARRLAQQVYESIQDDDHGAKRFNFATPDTAPVLLIVDRRDDPVTPLLSQWTYQAMVHELLGIHNNRVDLSHVPGTKKDMKEVILSADQDEFYGEVMYHNFGELGQAIKDVVDQFQQKTQSNRNISSIADMKRFVEEYPEFRKLSANVSKHVTVSSELSKIVDSRRLMVVSELEQELACNSGHSEALRQINELINDSSIDDDDMLRLVLLYALRYERSGSNDVTSLIEKLAARGMDAEKRRLISGIIEYGGASVRGGDLFGNMSVWSRMKSGAKKGLRVEGIENVFTQHKPLIWETVEMMLRGKLKEADFPFVGNPASPGERPQEIIIFIVGGATYEEAARVAELNRSGTCRVVLGATGIHNSASFLADVQQSTGQGSSSRGASAARPSARSRGW